MRVFNIQPGYSSVALCRLAQLVFTATEAPERRSYELKQLRSFVDCSKILLSHLQAVQQ